MSEPRDSEADFTPLTPVMPDEDMLDAPRQALAMAQTTLRTVRELLPLGKVALSDPDAALREAERQVAEKQAAVDEILDRMLNRPGDLA